MLRTILALAAVAICLAAFSAALAQQAPPAEGNQAQLLAVLQSEAPLFDKAKACQQLAVIGNQEAVPVLAKLLSDAQLAHYARFGLEPNPHPAVDEALRQALTQLEGGLLVGVINSIGMRRDAQAVESLTRLAGSSQPEVAAAAADALGRIATPQSIGALRQMLGGAEFARTLAGKACLTAAQMLLAEGKKPEAIELYDAVSQADLPRYLHLAALQSAIVTRGSDAVELMLQQLRTDDKALFGVGLAAAHELGGTQVTQALVGELGKLPPVRQTLLIRALGNRGDKAALPAVVDAAKTGPVEVRVAAAGVLATLGDASAVPVLLEMAAQADAQLATAARESLVELPGQEVDAALTGMFQKSAGDARVLAMEMIGQRGVGMAVPLLMEAAAGQQGQARLTAIRALGSTVDFDRLNVLIDALLEPADADVAAAAKEALGKACLRMPDRDACATKLADRLPDAPDAAKDNLLELLGVVGGDKALQTVSAVAREGTERGQDAATRVLGEWMSPAAAPVLLDLAKTGSDRYKVRALRGYIRLIRQFGSIPDAEKLAMCREAFAAAQRDDERRLALEAAQRVASRESLDMVLTHLDNPELKEAAGSAAVSIGERILNSERAAVAEAMKRVLQATGDTELANRAKAVLGRAENPRRRARD